MWYNAAQVGDATEMDVQGGRAQCLPGTPAHPAAEKPSCLQTQCSGGLPSCLVAIGATEYHPGRFIHAAGAAGAGERNWTRMCHQVQKSCISTLPWGLLFPPTTVLFRFVILGLGRLGAFLRTSSRPPKR